MAYVTSSQARIMVTAEMVAIFDKVVSPVSAYGIVSSCRKLTNSKKRGTHCDAQWCTI